MPRLIRLLALAAPMLLVWWMYGSAVTLPFYTDDANHYRFFQTVESGLALWTGQTWSPYYRPFVYSLWWGLIQVQGGFDPVAHHFVNLPAYGLSGVLLSLLLVRLTSGPSVLRLMIAVAAGCAFVTFPFHYQAVFQVGSLFHLMMVLGVLAALLFGLRALEVGTWQAIFGTALAAFVAVFSHETGFVVAPLLVVLGLIHTSGRITRRLLLVVAPVIAVAGLYVLLWLLLPRVGTEGGLRFTQSLIDNLGVLLQPFAYPAAAVVRPWVEGKASAGLLIGLFAAWLGVGLWLAWQLERRALRWMLFGVFWYLSGIALPVAMLQPDYVWSSPRLTMLASVGAVMFVWALLYHLWVSSKRFALVRRVVIFAAFVALMVFNVEFLSQRQAEYLLMRDYAWSLIAVMREANAAEEGALLVNPPDYVEAPAKQRAFLAQAQFASFMSPEVDYRDYLAVNSWGLRYTAPIEAVGVGRIMMHQAHLFVTPLPLIDGAELLERLRVERPIIVTQHAADRFFPVWVGRYGATMERQPLARFGDGAVLLTGAEPLRLRDGRLQLALQWQVENPIPAKIFVHVLRDGQLIAQGDGYPWADLYPFSAWQAGEIQIDRREVTLPAGVTLDSVTVLIGLYNENTGERYTLGLLGDGSSAEQNALQIHP
ncbi:MAG: hypothetical protein SNJ83_11810 [Aggregatilineales bacterium]